MKQFRRALVVVLAACLLTGCAASVPQTTEPPATTGPVMSETTQVAPAQDGFGLSYVEKYGFNPYSCTCLTNRPIISLVYESLFVLDGSYEPEPVLCESYTVSDDGKTYILTLCPEAKFSDGSAVSADDVVASLRAASGSDYYGSRFSNVSRFSATDAQTVQVTLSIPYENFLVLLDVPVVQAETVTNEIPIGSGAYTIRLGSEPCLLRNGSWWQATAAAVEYESITLSRATTPTDVRDSFEFGTTSLVCADPNSPSAIGYRCDYELWDCPTTVMQYIGFNLGSELFANQAMRTAITRIIDRSTITAKIYNGFAEPAVLPCSPSSRLYDETLADAYAYDETAFAQALQAAGFQRGTAATLLVCSVDASRVEAAHTIADALTKYGFDITVRAVDSETYQSTLNRGSYDFYIGEVRLSGSFDLSEFFKSGGSVCIGGIRDDSTLALCKRMLENSGNCYELYKQVLERGYLCPILFKSYAVMATRGIISTLQPAVDCVFHLPGGRTLADATQTPEETEAPTEETQPTQETAAPGE